MGALTDLGRCPLRVKSRGVALQIRCLLFPRKRASIDGSCLPAWCQKEMGTDHHR